MHLKINLPAFDIALVVRYGYRTARIENIFFDLSYDAKDEIDQFQDKLALLSRSRSLPDNHEVYEVFKKNEASICFWFSDWHCYIGTGLKKENW